MPFRPATVPRWATNAPSGALVEPIAYARANGFATNERPPAAWLNWEFGLTGNWIDFLRSASLANWTYNPTASLAATNITNLDVDNVSVEATAPVRRMVGVDDSNGAHVWATVRGNDWTQLAVTIGAGTLGAPRSILFTGDHWILATVNGSTGELWSTPSGGGAIYDPTIHWNAVTLPGGVTEIDALGAHRDPVSGLPLELVAVSIAGIYYATSLSGTLAFAAASTSGTPASAGGIGFCDVLWTGTRWAALNANGEVWTCATANGTWIKTATLTTSSPPYLRRLASDGAGNVLAYPVGASSADAWWVSTDGGASFTSQTAPVFTKISRVRFVNGTWLLASALAPFLASANDTGTSSWVRLPVPIPDASLATPALFGCIDVGYVDGAYVATGQYHWLLSRRAEDVAPGTYTPGTAPLLLHDAAYLRGTPVQAAAPNDGDDVTYNATTAQLEYHPAGAVVRGRRVTASPDAPTAADAVLLVDTTSAKTINLGASSSYGATATRLRRLRIKDATGGAGTKTITINASGGETIEGASALALNVNWQGVTLETDGSGVWWKV